MMSPSEESYLQISQLLYLFCLKKYPTKFAEYYSQNISYDLR